MIIGLGCAELQAGSERTSRWPALGIEAADVQSQRSIWQAMTVVGEVVIPFRSRLKSFIVGKIAEDPLVEMVGITGPKC